MFKNRPQVQKLKKQQKNRLNTKQLKQDRLIHGTYGIFACNAHYLHPKQLEALRKIIVRTLRVYQKKFYIWNRLFPFYNFTSKSSGARMGKGKGKVKYWLYKVHKGQIILEWDQEDILEEACVKIVKECQYKLHIKIRLISLQHKNVL